MVYNNKGAMSMVKAQAVELDLNLTGWLYALNESGSD